MARPPPDPVFVLKGEMESVSCLAYGTNEKLYAGTLKGMVHVWDLKKNREDYSFKVGGSSCLAIITIDDNIITQEKGGTITSWRISENKFLKQNVFESSHCGFCKMDICLISGNTHLYVPLDNSKIQILESLKMIRKCLLVTEGLNLGEVLAIRCIDHPPNPYLLSGHESGHLLLWDTEKQKCLSVLHLNITPMAIDFDKDVNRGICGCESDQLYIIEMNPNRILSVKTVVTLTNPGVSCISIRQDKKIIAVGGWDGNVRLFSWKNLKLLAVLTEHQDSIQDLCFSLTPTSFWKSKHLLAVGCKDKRVSLWNLYNQ